MSVKLALELPLDGTTTRTQLPPLPDLQLLSSAFDYADTTVPKLAACLNYCFAALLISQATN